MVGEETDAKTLADGVREYMLVTYIEPALGLGQTAVQLVSACWQGLEEIAASK
jgi:hypothetical protein